MGNKEYYIMQVREEDPIRVQSQNTTKC